MYKTVLDFWFKESTPANWFTQSEEYDQIIRALFAPIHLAATQGELNHWRDTIHGRLAEVIVLDQFSRNLYRNDARAFENDGMALVLAQEALKDKDIDKLSLEEYRFLIMPLMHSESAFIHKIALNLFEQPGLESVLPYEIKHKEIIDKFGRYPHRNKVLNRPSTAEELEFLETFEGF